MSHIQSSSGLEFVINEKGEKTKVVLPFETYERMLEDLHDLLVIAERRGGETLSLEEFKARMSSYKHIEETQW